MRNEALGKLVLCAAAISFFSAFTPLSAALPDKKEPQWTPLFNGTNLDGWYIVIRNGRSEDTNHLVQVDDGAVHMYKDAVEGSPQPSGYISTSNEFSHYHLRLQYRWGQKRFFPRAHDRRDAGILYHVEGKDGVWPRSIECQIQENDVGDIFTVNTRLTALVNPATTNLVKTVITNPAGEVHTNTSSPVYLAPEAGGVPYVQGVAGGIRRVIRSPMNEHPGWNTVEVIVNGDEATYIVNGKINNRVTKLQHFVNGRWEPLTRGRITLQLEFSEVFYRNIEIKVEPEQAGAAP
jgi:hypothetical protein